MNTKSNGFLFCYYCSTIKYCYLLLLLLLLHLSNVRAKNRAVRLLVKQKSNATTKTKWIFWKCEMFSPSAFLFYWRRYFDWNDERLTSMYYLRTADVQRRCSWRIVFPLGNRRSASLKMAQDRLYRTRRDAEVFVEHSDWRLKIFFSGFIVDESNSVRNCGNKNQESSYSGCLSERIHSATSVLILMRNI